MTILKIWSVEYKVRGCIMFMPIAGRIGSSRESDLHGWPGVCSALFKITESPPKDCP